MRIGSLLLGFAIACSVPVNDLETQATRNNGGDVDGTTPSSTLPPSKSTSTPDAGVDATAPPASSCDPTKPFGKPALVVGLDGGEHESTPRLSANELTIYFTIHVNDVAKLARATRATRNDPWSKASQLLIQGSGGKDNDPSVSADDKMLWFSSARNGDDDLFFALRAAPNVDFGLPQSVPALASAAKDQHPYFRVAADEIWFASQRTGRWGIFVSKRTNGTFATPQIVPELSDGTTRQPMITEDGLTMLVGSERGGLGGQDIFMATRATATGPFGTPVALTEVNSIADDNVGWISPDRCRIYLSSDRDSDRHHIYMAERGK